ncbi:MAG: restriction endonuclease [bacterium]|nr:restriction endonuclease [bacterium]
MKVTKASGEQEIYNRQKLCNSLKAAGAPKDLVDRVCRMVEKEITPGMTTQEISERTRAYLLKESPMHAARYSLRRGIMELGPSGFLFEQYVAALLKEYGYSTKTNQIMKGESGVFHEIDVFASTKDTHYIIEAKYHNSRGIKSDVTVVMYLYARLLDIEEYKREKEKEKHTAWLFTNTKFTRSAIQYGAYKNIRMTGWKYPKKESLEKLIEGKSLYPVTVLPSVNRYATERFAERKLYFAKDLVSLNPQQFKKLFGINQKIAQNIRKEAILLCGQN